MADRTPISLVIDTDYECSRPRAVTSVINRYYDPTTDEFLSIDPDVADTDQPYVFTNDDPLNAEDPLGLSLLSALKSIGKVVVKIVTVASDLQSGDLAGAAKTLHKTLGVCVNGSAGFGIAGSGSACIGATGNGKVFTSLTGGGGGGSPNASAGIGFLISNAKTAQQLGRNFSYGSGSVGEGLSVGGEGAIGTSSNNKTIVVGTFSLNIGGPLPLQFQGGESWTIVKQW